MLLKVKQEHPTLTTLCGFKGDATSIDLSGQGLGLVDAMLIAPEISVMGVLTQVRALLLFARPSPTAPLCCLTLCLVHWHRSTWLTTSYVA